MMLLDTHDPLLDAIPPNESIQWSSHGRLTWVVYLDIFLWLKWLIGLGFAGLGIGWLVFVLWQYRTGMVWGDLDFILINLSASVLTAFGGLGILRQSWLRFKDIQETRCVATAEKLYIWMPSKELNVLFWPSIPDLQAQFFAAGVFSLYYTDADRRRYLFHHVVGDAAALQQLKNLRWRSFEGS